ncbi:MAG TPA: hypothetical protein VFJ17_11425 [Mycobacteriales bacterium]|jgi:hypothetical protein|nr:hypothetical protein [Mycobacteriales bacterium]
MLWTKEKTTFLGTHYVKHGKWHGVPFTINAHGAKGITRTGWVVFGVTLLLLIAVVLVEEFVL